MLLHFRPRAYLFSPDEGSCYVFSNRNNCCEFLASSGVTFQSVIESFLQMVTLYECITCSFVIDEYKITEIFSGCIVNFVKHVSSTSPDHDYFLWVDLKNLVIISFYNLVIISCNLAYLKLLQVCLKYLASLNLCVNCSNNIVKHVSLLVDAILNSFCKHYTCARRFQ